MKLALTTGFVLGMVATGSARAANPIVVMQTSLGTIKIELFEDKSPATVQNFLGYVDDKFYDGTIFHRVMGKENSERGFMVQGGGFTADKKEKDTKGPIKNEATNGLSNTRGTLAMARTRNPDSATAQFFINVVDNTVLVARGATPGYAVFGKVIEGMDVVDKIKAVKTGESELEMKHPSGGRLRMPNENAPVDNVVIKSVRRQTELKTDK